MGSIHPAHYKTSWQGFLNTATDLRLKKKRAGHSWIVFFSRSRHRH